MTEEQELALRAYGRDAVIALAHTLIENADELVELAQTRASTLGVSEYGDISYHKHPERLEVEVNEELADAIFYMHILLMLRERGTIDAKVVE